MRKEINLSKELLEELYIKANKTVVAIAIELDISTASVNRKLKEFGIKKSEEQRRLAIATTKQAKTEEEKQEYAKHISEARKGKGIGGIPWNKGKHTGNGWQGRHHSEKTKQKISETKLAKTPEQKAEIEAKRKASRGQVIPWNKGKSTGKWSDEQKNSFLKKQYQTKLKNGSFNTSQPEDAYYSYLVEKYGEADIVRQYSTDPRYPFACDFYIKSLDLFIELNLTWTHGGKLFTGSEEDLTKLAAWQEKAKNSDFYKNAVETWTQRDVKKAAVAKENNLNYLVYYTETELPLQ